MQTGLRRLGVLGGTFDPIHEGHVTIASEAANRMDLDRIVFIPAARPWQKSGYSHPEDRFMMTILATTADPRFSVSRIELDRQGPTYSADTMKALREFYGEAIELFFIAGADAVANIHSWKKLEEFAELAQVIAVARPGHPLATSSDRVRVNVLEIEGMDVSGTDIRHRIAQRRPIDGLVHPDVAAFISERGLYRRLEEAI